VKSVQCIYLNIRNKHRIAATKKTLFLFYIFQKLVVKESNKIKDPVVVRKPVPAQGKTPKPLIPRTSLSSPSDSVVYNVKKGDTLYRITERYTGDGWNYPKVARENEIPNPDLIFPDQKINIRK